MSGCVSRVWIYLHRCAVRGDSVAAYPGVPLRGDARLFTMRASPSKMVAAVAGDMIVSRIWTHRLSRRWNTQCRFSLHAGQHRRTQRAIQSAP